jgi:hypothetical protein
VKQNFRTRKIRDSLLGISYIGTYHLFQKGEELTLCASYTGDKKSTDMVVIEAELLTGFTPYETSLEALLNEVQEPTVMKYEIR